MALKKQDCINLSVRCGITRDSWFIKQCQVGEIHFEQRVGPILGFIAQSFVTGQSKVDAATV